MNIVTSRFSKLRSFLGAGKRQVTGAVMQENRTQKMKTSIERNICGSLPQKQMSKEVSGMGVAGSRRQGENFN